jgi:hypothetical protein
MDSKHLQFDHLQFTIESDANISSVFLAVGKSGKKWEKWEIWDITNYAN